MIKKNTFVLIKKTILNPNERALNIPSDTKSMPFVMWVKGILQHDAHLGDEVTIQTKTNRLEFGVLIQENPYYDHDFGCFVEELKEVEHIILEETEDLS